jgi:hypothetical protein
MILLLEFDLFQSTIFFTIKQKILVFKYLIEDLVTLRRSIRIIGDIIESHTYTSQILDRIQRNENMRRE